MSPHDASVQKCSWLRERLHQAGKAGLGKAEAVLAGKGFFCLLNRRQRWGSARTCLTLLSKWVEGWNTQAKSRRVDFPPPISPGF